jgi:hypothetical protein
MSLDIRQAIQFGKTQLIQVLPEFAITLANPADLRLEEIRRDGDKGEDWALTFSFPNPDYPMADPVRMLGTPPTQWGPRLAKVIVVNGVDGKMTEIREREAA